VQLKALFGLWDRLCLEGGCITQRDDLKETSPEILLREVLVNCRCIKSTIVFVNSWRPAEVSEVAVAITVKQCLRIVRKFNNAFLFILRHSILNHKLLKSLIESD
jgi:hypothetical protein